MQGCRNFIRHIKHDHLGKLSSLSRLHAQSTTSESVERYQKKGRIKDFQRAIFVAYKNNEFQQLFQIFNTFESKFQPTLSMYHTLIAACSKNKQWNKSIETLNSMKEKGIKPTLSTLNSVLQICGKYGKYEKILKLLNSMNSSFQLEPDITSYNTLLCAYNSRGKWENALGLFLDLKNSSSSSSSLSTSTITNVKPDHYTYTTLIKGLEKQNQFEKAIEIFYNIEKDNFIKPNNNMFNLMIEICIKHKQYKDVFILFHIMITHFKLQPNSFTLKLVHKTLEKCNDNEIIKEEDKKQLLNMLTDYSMMIENETTMTFDQLMMLIHRKNIQHINFKCFLNVIQKCEQNGNGELAYQTLVKMFELDILPNITCFGMAISACHIKNRKKKNSNSNNSIKTAQKIFHLMETHNIEPNHTCYGSMIHVYAQHGQPMEAIQVLRRMEINGLVPNIICYNSAIYACSHDNVVKRQWKKALELLTEMEIKYKLIPNLGCFNIVIHACAKKGKYLLANKIFHSMQEEPYSLQPNVITYSNLLKAYENGKQWDLALDLFQEIEKKRQNVLSDTISISSNDNKMNNNITLPDVMFYNTMLKVCGTCYQWEFALNILNQMITQNQVEDENSKNKLTPDIISFTTAMDACEISGQYDKALEIFSQIEHGKFHHIKLNANCCHIAMLCWIKKGDLIQALDLLNRMELEPYNITPTEIFFVGLINSLEKTNEFENKTIKNNNNNNDDDDDDGDNDLELDRNAFAIDLLKIAQSRHLIKNYWLSETEIELFHYSNSVARTILRSFFKDIQLGHLRLPYKKDIVLHVGKGYHSERQYLKPEIIQRFLINENIPFFTENIPGLTNSHKLVIRYDDLIQCLTHK